MRSSCADGRFVAARIGAERIEARACVLAAGGFESNREWLREAWGQNGNGEWPADNFLIRGTRFNMGVLLKFMIDAGADSIGDPSQSHCVAIDARAPLYDGGICTRIDCVSLGVVRQSRWRALLRRRRRLLAQALRDLGPAGGAAAGTDRLFDHRRQGHRPLHAAGVSRARRPASLPELARQLGLDEATFVRTDRDTTTRRAVSAPSITRSLDDCHTEGLDAAKDALGAADRHAAVLWLRARPGITFTYLGLKVNEQAAVHFGGVPSPNLFVAGEMMAGNVLGKGYTAGVGMSIGTAFGRIAGTAGARPPRSDGEPACRRLRH